MTAAARTRIPWRIESAKKAGNMAITGDPDRPRIQPSGRVRQSLSTLDAMLLIGSAALGLGVRQAIWRGFFKN